MRHFTFRTFLGAFAVPCSKAFLVLASGIPEASKHLVLSSATGWLEPVQGRLSTLDASESRWVRCKVVSVWPSKHP